MKNLLKYAAIGYGAVIFLMAFLVLLCLGIDCVHTIVVTSNMYHNLLRLGYSDSQINSVFGFSMIVVVIGTILTISLISDHKGKL